MILLHSTSVLRTEGGMLQGYETAANLSRTFRDVKLDFETFPG